MFSDVLALRTPSHTRIMRWWRRQLFVLSFLAAMPLANFTSPLVPPWDDIHVKHTWIDVPPNWETLGTPSSNATIDLHIALVPQFENALIDALYEVSTPGHPRYGAHLTKEQVAQLVAPHSDTLQLINSWLEHHHISPLVVSMTHGGSWLTVTAFRPSGKNETTILRTIGYTLPAVLHNHIRTVVPTTCFASAHPLWQIPRKRAVGATVGRGSRDPGTVLSSRTDEDEREIDPSDLRSLYRTVDYVPVATDKNAIGVAGFSGHYPSPADLETFMRTCRTDAIDAAFRVEKINGGEYDATHPSREANQNIQYTQAIAYPTPHTFYSIGGEMSSLGGSNEPAEDDEYLTWLNHLIKLEKVPQTISASYGVYEKTFPVEYTTALCDLFAQLGARGVSILFPSGNEGVGFKEDCQANDGSGRVQFIPEFPTSCPWVTSVGGTMREFPEVAAFFSGGGFSNHFPRPIYQNPAVPNFLKQLGNRYDGLYNSAGRGIPDVAAQAFNYFIVDENKGYKQGGTSCATPTVAAIISLLNDYLLSMGKKPLGFLNPWLYSLGVVGMNDITSGSNPGCGTEGFSAIAGWDPVTGLGTPDFLNLQAIIDYMNQFSSQVDKRTAIIQSLLDFTNTSRTDVRRQETDKYF
ncbi:peptidase S8/S53 domain-containing protein [Lactarius quietus]|nr:peptidase S8/S53 domain-containing protein [Lactarius quietus]